MELSVRPGIEEKPVRLAARRNFGPIPPFPRLAIAVCFASSLCLASRTYPQAAAPAPADVDSGKVQPLGLTPGCWECAPTNRTQAGGPNRRPRKLEEIRKAAADIAAARQKAGDRTADPATIAASLEQSQRQTRELAASCPAKGRALKRSPVLRPHSRKWAWRYTARQPSRAYFG